MLRGLRDPIGVFRNPGGFLRSHGNLGVAEKVLRNRTGYCEGTREIFGFPRSVRGFPPRVFGPRRVGRSERLRPFAAKPAFPPWSERRRKLGVRPAEPTGRVAVLGRFAFRVYLLGAAVRATAGVWPRQVRYRQSGGRRKTPPPSCVGALTGSTRRRGSCPPPEAPPRERSLAPGASLFA